MSEADDFYRAFGEAHTHGACSACESRDRELSILRQALDDLENVIGQALDKAARGHEENAP